MHIIWIGYLFVVMMISAAQPSIARALIYLVFLAVIPTFILAWILRVRRRNRQEKQREKTPQTPDKNG